MKGNNQTTPFSDTLLLQSVSKIISSHYSALQQFANYGLLDLFWNIGSEINRISKADGIKKDVPETVLRSSLVLSEQFGDYLSQNGLQLMAEFNFVCPRIVVNNIASLIDWDYIPVMLGLKTDELWIYYTILVVKSHLSPIELENQIKNQSSELLSSLSNISLNDLNSKLSDIKEFPIKNFFKAPYLDSFKQLFDSPIQHPDESNARNSLKDPELSFVNAVINLIQKYRKQYTRLLNIRFNFLYWDIGKAISYILSTSAPDAKQDSIMQLSKSIEKLYGELLNLKEITCSIKFYSAVKDLSDARNIAEVMEWEDIALHVSADDNIIMTTETFSLKDKEELNLFNNKYFIKFMNTQL